jgi:hypothetical protein
MINKRFIPMIAIIGTLILICSISVLCYLKNYNLLAVNIPSIRIIKYPLTQSFSVDSNAEKCHIIWYIEPYNKYMLEGSDLRLSVSIFNNCREYEIRLQISVDAPDFAIKQSDHIFFLNPTSKKTIEWILKAPKVGGTFLGVTTATLLDNYTVSRADDSLFSNNLFPFPSVQNIFLSKDSENFSISVNSPLGIFAQIFQLLSSLGVFLGPMLTLPWWYEQWQKRKRQRKARKSFVISSPSQKKRHVGKKVKRMKS